MSNPKHILIVDDDKFLLDIYSLKFSNMGYEVDIAFGGEEAIKKIKENKPDILLLDIVMPGMDGIEVLKRIRDEGLEEGLIRIVLSNQSQPADVDKATALDVDCYIIKASNTPSEVVAKVNEYLDKK
jgi:two-component system, OmpR family, alkaline phosphatase synthesis response regulator PhoP